MTLMLAKGPWKGASTDLTVWPRWKRMLVHGTH